MGDGEAGPRNHHASVLEVRIRLKKIELKDKFGEWGSLPNYLDGSVHS